MNSLCKRHGKQQKPEDLEQFEYTKEVIRIRKSKKERQHNGQKRQVHWISYIIYEL